MARPSTLNALVVIAATHDIAALVGNASETDAMRLKAESRPMLTIVATVMVMAMKTTRHTQMLSQLIQRLKAMRMRARGFVRDQDIGLLHGQPGNLDGENRAAMLARQAIAPMLIQPALGQKVLGRYMPPGLWREPDLAAKNATQAGNPVASNLCHTAMQIA